MSDYSRGTRGTDAGWSGRGPGRTGGAIYDKLRGKATRRGYLRQNAGVNSTSTLKISSRPRNMAAMQTQVWKSLSD